jgi:hypothetical protein
LSTNINAGERDWDKTDYTLLGIATATLIADWGQTRSIAKNEDKWKELNLILGEHPSVGRVNTYFATSILATAGVAYLLKDNYRKGFLLGIIILETVVVIRNQSLGIHFSF